jgi:MFS transporter, PPP family, 3-phenylpropionic acid transporter
MPVAARLAAFYFAYFAYAGAFVPYFPLYLAGRGYDARQIALVLALPAIARTFAPAFWGWLADRSGAWRGIAVFSCAALVASFALMPFAAGLAELALLVAAMSVLSAGALPLVEAITLTALTGRSGRYGPVRLWGSIGFIAGVLAIGSWLDARAVDTLPAMLLVLSLAALLVSLLLPRRTPARVTDRGEELGAELARPAIRALLAAGFCMAVAHGALYAFFTLHLERLGYAGATIGALWTLGVLAEIAVFLYLPAIFRRFKLSTILLVSFLCAALRFAAIGWASQLLVVLVLAQVLHALTFGAYHAASVASVHRLFPASAHGQGQALFSSLSYGAGGAAGMLLAGWTWDAGGPSLAFSCAGLVAALGAVLVVRIRRAGM